MIVTRRGFLALTGATAIGTAIGGGSLTRWLDVAATAEWSFRSRPDLHPVVVRVSTAPSGLAGGHTFLTPGGPLIVDDSGEPVWVHHDAPASADLRVQRYRGQPVLTWWQGNITDYGIGQGEGVVMDSSYRQLAVVRGVGDFAADLHELTLTSRGSAYITAYGVATADLRAVGGPRRATLVEAAIQEIDLETGELLFEWRASDHLALTESYATWSRSSPFDPVHLNSIEELPDGNLLVSARNTWALYKLDRTTGAVIWRLGGKQSDFVLDEGTRFAWQHDARAHADGSISLFDDEAAPPEGRQSRGIVLAVDESGRRARLQHSYVHGPKPLLATSEGSVQTLPVGYVFVGWGSQPWFSAHDAAGEVVLDGRIMKGHSYRAYRFDWNGTPLDTPAVAVEPLGSTACVFVSWNGSTETVAWRVIGGTSPERLEALTSTARSGFETRIVLPRSVPHLAVQALSSTGAVLATSRTVAL